MGTIVKIPNLRDKITEPCRLFVLEHSQLLQFVAFIVHMAERSDEMSQRAAKFLLKFTQTEQERERHKLVAEQGGGALAHLDEYLPLVQQFVLCREVDNFLTYIAQILALVFRTHPVTLRSKETERLDYILQYTSMEEMIAALAEKKVNELSYKGLHELERYLSDKIGFDLLTEEEARERVWFLVEARNLVVHNRGIVNAFFQDRMRHSKHASAKLGARISLGGGVVNDGLDLLYACALDIDARAAAKWSLPLETFCPPQDFPSHQS